jgi:ATP-binding cassette subfamily B protein AbcA/BmrA
MMAPQEEMRADGSAEIPQGDVVFQSVSFGYQPERPVLTDVELTIPRGKNTAIVGPSGSGKTTLLKLMEQLYQPTAGQISVGGVAVDTLNLSAWRKSLSYVTQDAVMFSGSVRECLTYGVQNAVTDEQLTAVTKLAGVYDYIQEQGGFDAQMSIWGSAMSGGQRQRMVIARELLKQADVLLLDEPTSALDAETAAGISDTIYQQFRGKTVVTVTHELSFISNADQIIVLDEGKVVDSGNHEELMQRCQIYRELVEEQSYQEVYGG